jgi:hypothetical protein
MNRPAPSAIPKGVLVRGIIIMVAASLAITIFARV